MGFYRFVLAISVVFFHAGGGGWLVGRVAVMAFYVISGYLIFRVLDTTYLDSVAGSGRFLVNRTLRLIPLLLVMMTITFIWVRAYGGIEVPILNGRTHYLHKISSDRGMLQIFYHNLLPNLTSKDGFPSLSFSPGVVPQAWSIGVEFCFYLIAPIVVIVYRFSRLAGAALTALSFGYVLSVVIADTDLGFFEQRSVHAKLGRPPSGVFGVPNHMRFGAFSILASAAFAIATLFVIERPVQRIRRLVRAKPAPDDVPVPAQA